jgi:hypothetical protein
LGGILLTSQADAVWTQQARIVAADGASGDSFGRSVAIDDGITVVGAGGNDGAGENSGAAYVFDASPESPTFGKQLRKLTASDANGRGDFGGALAMDAGLAIIGAERSQNSTGAAYLFDVNPARPTFGLQLRKLISTDLQYPDQFGGAVDIHNGLAIVGAISGGRECGGIVCGAVYLFDVNPQSPTFGQQLLRLTASNAHENNTYGRAVAIHGKRAMVTARGGAATNFQGSVYLIDVDPQSPSFGQELLRLNAPAFEVAMDERVAIVPDVGGVRVLDIDPQSPTYGTPLRKLTASDATVRDLGGSMAISNGTAIIGSDTETAYVFDVNPLSTTFGQQLFKLTSSGVSTPELFGRYVDLSGDAAIIGAPSSTKGSAYVFSRQPVPEPSASMLTAMALLSFAQFRQRMSRNSRTIS